MPLISISSIIITGERHRKEMGDLAALAESIQSIGLLQPIGVTNDYQLIFGERRLRACRDVLKLSKIEARIITLSSLVAGEYAENELRKDFTPSERVAIAKALEEQIPERRGNPSIRQNFDELKGRTDDYVARQAGFGNHQTLRDAKKVVKNGIPKLIAAMDEGKVAISTAARIARLTPAEQSELQNLEPRAINQVLRRAAEQSPVQPNHGKLANKLKASSLVELFDELKNHQCQLKKILAPKCSEQSNDMHMQIIEKRMIMRLLGEMQTLLDDIEQVWVADQRQT